jgi:tRNA pseudouridine13 synthase
MPEDFVQFLTKSTGDSDKDGTFEVDVGITEFMNPELEGFDAILKHRFSDFNVNEIDLDGKVVYLTSLDIPRSVAKVISLIIYN